MMGDVRFYIVVCYIPPSNLETLVDINKAWRTCPTGVHPIVVGNLNINLCAPRMESKETIAKQVNATDLIDLFRHFYQCLGTWLWGWWTWQMRREGRWVCFQCNYFLGRETNCRRFQHVSVQMPCYYSNHCALVAVIYEEGGGGTKAVLAMDPVVSPLPPPRPTVAA
jgi:hypothetical protein